MRPRLGLRVALMATGLLTAVACAGSTEPAGPTATLLGTWTYTGTQASPALELVGTLVVSTQNGAELTGSLTWEERDAVGGVITRAAPIGGRVIGLSDTDFDLLAPDAIRRHVARISANADTIDGVWIASTVSRNGSFRAVRRVTP